MKIKKGEISGENNREKISGLASSAKMKAK